MWFGHAIIQMQNPNFDKQCEDCIKEMIENHYNHPSIFIWGILNERSSDTKEGYEKYKRQYEQIKSLDQSRPTTSATYKDFTDITLGLPDVVSVNLYSGWYQQIDIQERNDQEITWIKQTEGNAITIRGY